MQRQILILSIFAAGFLPGLLVAKRIASVPPFFYRALAPDAAAEISGYARKRDKPG